MKNNKIAWFKIALSGKINKKFKIKNLNYNNNSRKINHSNNQKLIVNFNNKKFLIYKLKYNNKSNHFHKI